MADWQGDYGDLDHLPTWEWQDREQAREEEKRRLRELAAQVAPLVASGDFAGARAITADYASPPEERKPAAVFGRVGKVISARWDNPADSAPTEPDTPVVRGMGDVTATTAGEVGAFTPGNPWKTGEDRQSLALSWGANQSERLVAMGIDPKKYVANPFRELLGSESIGTSIYGALVDPAQQQAMLDYLTRPRAEGGYEMPIELVRGLVQYAGTPEGRKAVHVGGGHVANPVAEGLTAATRMGLDAIHMPGAGATSEILGGIGAGVTDALTLGALSGASGSNTDMADPAFWNEAVQAGVNRVLMVPGALRPATAGLESALARIAPETASRIGAEALGGAALNTGLAGIGQAAMGEFDPQQLAVQAALGAAIPAMGMGISAAQHAAAASGAVQAAGAGATRLHAAEAGTARADFGLGDIASRVKAKWGASRAPEAPDMPPRPPGALRYDVPNMGTAAIDAALAAKREAMKAPGVIFQAMPERLRKIVGVANPNATMPHEVVIAHSARVGTRAALETDFARYMEPYISRLERELKERPPTYIGPAKNRIAGTVKDMADHPDFYQMDPAVSRAFDAYDQAQWRVSAYVRSQYGVDVAPYSNDIPGSAYTPTVLRRASSDVKVETASQSLSAASRTKGRSYEGAYDRMQKHADFVPETDLRELTNIHNQAMAQNAANAVFQAGAGGLTKADVMVVTHPELAAMRERVRAAVDSFTGKLATAEQRAAKAAASAAAMAKPLERLQNGVLDRSTARVALQQARKELNRARREATSTARAAGSATARDQAARAAFEAAQARADRAVAQIQAAQKEALGLGEVLPVGMGVRLPEVQGAAVARALQEAELATQALRGMAGRATMPRTAEAASNASMLRRGVAEIDAKAAGEDLKVAIDDTLNAAKGVAPDAVYSVMRGLESRVDALRARGAGWERTADTLRQQLDRAKADWARVSDAWHGAGTDPFVYSPQTFRYHTPEQAAAIRTLLSQPAGLGKRFIDAADEVRSVVLAGDASPFTIQGALGALASPVSTVKAVVKMLAEGSTLDNLVRSAPEDVRQFEMATGRSLRTFGTSEFQTNRGLGRLPVVGGINQKMFTVVQRIQFEMWKNDRDWLLQHNPSMTANVAAHEAANMVSKVIPSLNPADRAVSPVRSGVERAVLTSLSFATSPAMILKDATSGLAKLARAATVDPKRAWQALDGREQLALRRATTLSGDLLLLSATSAVLSADSRGLTVEQALKEQFDPSSRYFLSIQLGGGHSVPIGGPYRSFAKALLPGRNGIVGEGLPKFLEGKLNTIPSTTVDFVRNKDFFGNEIRQGDFPEQVLRSLWYGVESTVPLTAGQVMEDVRTGSLNEGTAERTAGQFLGSSMNPPSPTEQLNQIARSRFGKDFYDLPPSQQAEIKGANASLWSDAVSAGSPKRQEYEAAKTQFLAEQAADDELVLAGELPPDKWEASLGDRKNQLDGKGAAIWGDGSGGKRGDPVLDAYYKVINEHTTNGRADWDAINAWKEQQSEADQKYIAANTGLLTTPLQKLRTSMLDEYTAIPKYRQYTAEEGNQIDELWQAVRNEARSADEVDMLRAMRTIDTASYDSSIVQGVRRRILGLLTQSSERDYWRKQHPESVLIFGKGKLSESQLQSIKDALSRQK